MERLRAAGLEPVVGHDAANLPEDAEVVVSTAIGEDNPELALARERGAEPIHRGALLAELCAEKRLIAVAGTHGKTTTTAMMVWALRGDRRRPGLLRRRRGAGAWARRAPPPTPAGAEGEWVVAEADESDASFLELRPEVAVVTNVEMDHHARWGSVAELHARLPRVRRRPPPAAVLPADGSLDELRRPAPAWSGSTPACPGPAELPLAVPGAPQPRQRPRRDRRDRARGTRRRRRGRARSPTSPASTAGSS